MSVPEICKQFWEWRLSTIPEFATLIGEHHYDSGLESYDISKINNKLIRCEEFSRQLSQASQSKDLSVDDKLNVKLLQDDLSGFIEGSKFHSFFYPINFLEGVQLDFERLLGWMTFNTEEDYRQLISRFKCFGQQADELIALMSNAVSQGYTNCEWSMKGVLGQFDDIVNVDDATKLPFYKPFTQLDKCDAIPEKTRQDLVASGKQGLVEFVMPGFRKLRDFLAKEYIPALRPHISINSVPGARPSTACYAACLAFHITCDMTPHQVHQVGVDEVARIRTRMEAVMLEVGFSGGLNEFFDHLRTSPQFYCTTKEELLSGYRDIVFNTIRPKLRDFFHTMPNMELVVREQSTLGPLAYYIAGSADGSRPGTFFVNTHDIGISPKYEMMSLALHEGEPGHHLQSSMAIEMKDLPEFRRYLEDRKYSDAPARFAMNTAYIEGWGLYSEALGEEMGVYTDPYMLFGRYSNEMYRACRLVVDTGMHEFGWSRERAIQYMRDHVGTSLQNIENEVNRYITWPGQACAYKIGEIKLHELRKYATNKLGARFDVREFHHEVLRHGAVPLAVLQRLVETYVTDTLAE